MAKKGEYKKKIRLNEFLRFIWDNPKNVYRWPEIKAKAEYLNLTDKEVRIYIKMAIEQEKIEKEMGPDGWMIYKFKQIKRGKPLKHVIYKRETKILRIWMQREHEWLNRKTIIKEAEKLGMNEVMAGRYLTTLHEEREVLEKKEFTTHKGKNTFYRPTGYLYEYSRGAPIVMLEKSYNNIPIPINPNMWISLHNFPDLDMLNSYYGQKLREGINKISEGYNLINWIRDEYANDCIKRFVKKENLKTVTESDRKRILEIYEKYIFCPLISTTYSLPYKSKKIEYPFNKDRGNILLNFLWRYLRFESDLMTGALWNHNKEITEEELDKELEKEKLGNLMKVIPLLFKTCLYKMWSLETKELEKEIDLLRKIRRFIKEKELNNINLTQSNIDFYIEKITDIKNLPKDYRGLGRSERYSRYENIIQEIKNAGSKEISPDEILLKIDTSLIDFALQEKDKFETYLKEINETSEDYHDLNQLIIDFGQVIPPSMEDLKKWGILPNASSNISDKM